MHLNFGRHHDLFPTSCLAFHRTKKTVVALFSMCPLEMPLGNPTSTCCREILGTSTLHTRKEFSLNQSRERRQTESESLHFHQKPGETWRDLTRWFGRKGRLLPSLMIRVQPQTPTVWKERTDSCKLFLTTRCSLCHTHSYIHTTLKCSD